MLFVLASSILEEKCATASEAVLLINQRLFSLLGVKYSTERRLPNQCVTESAKLGLASCTGLSIILVQALRSVGIPARGCGTALWAKVREQTRKTDLTAKSGLWQSYMGGVLRSGR